MAGRLIDDDPALAFAHAEAARRRASRLPVAREASAETAYAAGEYAHALNEYRALRRMTGSAEYLPVIMDCERALGRPQRALQLAREATELQLDAGTRVEILIVESGARADLGQDDEALRLLRTAVSRVHHPAEPAARLRFAYAEMLLDDDPEQARALLAEADLLDPESGARERLEELDGVGVLGIELAEDEPEEYDPLAGASDHDDERDGHNLDEDRDDDVDDGLDGDMLDDVDEDDLDDDELDEDELDARADTEDDVDEDDSASRRRQD